MNPWDMVLALLLAIWINGFVVGMREAMFERGEKVLARGIDLAFGLITVYLALSRWP